LRCNDQIRISPVRLINQSNEQLGIVPIVEALRVARETGLDLVEVSPRERPPVCRIMDYGKWKYKQRKKEQKSHAGSHVQQLKELRIRSVKIDVHDQNTTANKARKFLQEGHKVQFNLMFRGREMAHVDLGRKILEKFHTDLEALGKIEREPKLEGRRMIMILAPKPHAAADGRSGRHAETKATANTAALLENP
jgi:translation initiation factor IF-3